jgi:EAL domain-containing protein (putative c-di-GMP-specific phosphodiesterase class I)
MRRRGESRCPRPEAGLRGPVILRRWVQLLFLVLIVDLVCTIRFKADELHETFQSGDLIGASSMLAWLLSPALALLAAGCIARGLLRTRSELNRSQQVLAADLATTGDWVWETNTQHRLTFSSPGVETLLGYPPQLLLGTTSAELIADDHEFNKALKGTPSATGLRSAWTETRSIWVHRDGHHVELEGWSTALLDERGRLVGFRGRRRAVDTGDRNPAQESAARLAVEEVLRSGDFDIALQPIVSLATGRLAGFEALARFRDGRDPASWFGDARACGLSVELEQLAFTTAAHLLAELPEPAYLSVNAGPALIINPQFARDLAGSSLPLERLVIEITEHARVTDYAGLRDAIKPLRRLGAQVAIDDTGAGYASLRHIVELRPDIIKLDRMLLAGLEDDSARGWLVTALVMLALDIGASVTAEGVETRAQLGALATLGVDNVQGYLLGKPSAELSRWRQWFDTRWPVDGPHAE